jgi:AcrR family transcriptional regulator
MMSQKGNPARRGSSASREAIFDAAEQCFAQKGYSLASIRDIAELAGVNSALVGRYAGTKTTLFREVLNRSLAWEPVLDGPLEGFGTRMVAVFREARTTPSPLSMMLLSMADPEARDIVQDMLDNRIIKPLAQYIGAPDADERAAKLNMLWSGFLIGVQLLPSYAATNGTLKRYEDWLAQETQAIVDASA